MEFNAIFYTFEDYNPCGLESEVSVITDNFKKWTFLACHLKSSVV
jgi:hypothetical protein